MIEYIAIIIACAVLMRIKGGLLKLLKISGGKYISAVGFALLCAAITGPLGLLGGVGWFLGNKPSLGEIVGAIGGYKGNWREEGKTWGWKQGIQRGVFTGACVSLCLWNPAFIIAGLLFPILIWVGVSLEQLRTGKVAASWHFFEYLFGAAIGAAFYG